MSILQNLTAIKIRGTYNKGGVGYLMNFKLDTAKIGRERGFAPANWVEKCSCPKAYVGDYCEECAPGFKHEPANGGPYSTCIPCDCNGHAHICDTATGKQQTVESSLFLVSIILIENFFWIQNNIIMRCFLNLFIFVFKIILLLVW